MGSGPGLARLAIVTHIVLSPAVYACQDEPPVPSEAIRWKSLADEHRINQLVFSLAERHKPQDLIFTNASVIDVAAGKVVSGQTIMVADGKIQAVGANVSEARRDSLRVDLGGKFVIPGLIDAHVHTLVSNSHYLLDLVNGVTSVREMCGFPWMLELREQVRGNRALCPNLYMTGTIINRAPMGMYAVVVRDAARGREVVREHRRLGYDFIKVHNVVPQDLYRAILDEARSLNVDVVGHVPHEVSLREAISSGQRTLEHFKGYYLDRTLDITTEDYVALTRGAQVWNCPTFYTRRIGWRGSDVADLLAREEARYVPWYERSGWALLAKSSGGENHRRVYELSTRIFKDLLSTDARFLAGTDSGGGYPMMVRGFALHDELQTMTTHGLSVPDALRSATINVAQAMRREGELGEVKADARADLVVLSANALDSIDNLRAIEAVMVRGIYLDAAALTDIKSRIAGIYAGGPNDPDMPTEKDMDALAQAVADLQLRGFVHMQHYLAELEGMLVKKDRPSGQIKAAREALGRGAKP